MIPEENMELEKSEECPNCHQHLYIKPEEGSDIDSLPLKFGRYKGLSAKQVAILDPQYLCWMYKTVTNYPTCSEKLFDTAEEFCYEHDEPEWYHPEEDPVLTVELPRSYWVRLQRFFKPEEPNKNVNPEVNMKQLFDSKKLMNRFLRPVENAVWDLTTGRIGIQSQDGIVTIEGEGEDAQVALNMIDQFGMPVPAFAQNTPKDSVKVGDFIYNGNRPLGWVTRLPDDSHKTFGLLSPTGTSSNWNPPKVSMIGMDDGVMVLRSLINMLPGGGEGLNGLNSMLMPMLLMSDGDLDMEGIMPMMLMMSMGNTMQATTDSEGNTVTNPMAGMSNIMMPMMMMQMFGGGKGRKGKGPFGGNYFDQN
jgi:hypothetical protein